MIFPKEIEPGLRRFAALCLLVLAGSAALSAGEEAGEPDFRDPADLQQLDFPEVDGTDLRGTRPPRTEIDQPRLPDSRLADQNAAALIGEADEVNEEEIPDIDPGGLTDPRQHDLEAVDEQELDEIDEETLETLDEQDLDEVDEETLDTLDDQDLDQIDRTSLDELDGGDFGRQAAGADAPDPTEPAPAGPELNPEEGDL